MRSLIIVPYAYLEKFSTGVNLRSLEKTIDTYMKNCCVACVSARINNDDDTDVALVTNFEIPYEYKKILQSYAVEIINCSFDSFSFGADYTWSLAFYKLCALKYVVENYDYDNYSYVDTDVYIQGNYNNIWLECASNILLYDINQGLNDDNYCGFLEEIQSFDSQLPSHLLHYGGEFFAANKNNTKLFVIECEKVYNRMLEVSFNSNYGDEFITSIAANSKKEIVKNGAAYVQRFWTGSMRLMSTKYKFFPVTVLHVPAEKEYGMIALFNSTLAKNKMLPDNNKIHKRLHLNRISMRTACIICLKKILTKKYFYL